MGGVKGEGKARGEGRRHMSKVWSLSERRHLTSLRSTPIMKCFLQKSSLRENSSILSAKRFQCEQNHHSHTGTKKHTYAELGKEG